MQTSTIMRQMPLDFWVSIVNKNTVFSFIANAYTGENLGHSSRQVRPIHNAYICFTAGIVFNNNNNKLTC